jgi:di/tricarboxylate transporter
VLLVGDLVLGNASIEYHPSLLILLFFIAFCCFFLFVSYFNVNVLAYGAEHDIDDQTALINIPASFIDRISCH